MIVKVKKGHYVVKHKNGRLAGRFRTKKAALKQSAAVHAYYDAHPKKRGAKKRK